MRNRIVHCSKIPDLLSIDSNRVDIFLEYSHDNRIKSFSVTKLDLSGMNLPPEATIELVCETSLSELYYPLGTPTSIQLIQQKDLSEHNLSQKPKFRIIIFVPGNPKLLAATDTIRIRNSDEDSSSKGLLPVNCVDNLEDRLWKLQISDSGAVLNVNNNQDVNMVRLLQENILVRSMVLPEAIGQVLDRIMRSDDTSRQWMQDWSVFAEQFGVDLFDPSLKEDDELRSASIDKIVMGWCKKLSLCEQIVAFKETEEGRS